MWLQSQMPFGEPDSRANDTSTMQEFENIWSQMPFGEPDSRALET